MSDLKPCPFCEAPAAFGVCEDEDSENWNGEFIACTNRQCGTTSVVMFPTMDSVKEHLAERWNRRSPDRAALLEVARRANATFSVNETATETAERVVTEYLAEQERTDAAD